MRDDIGVIACGCCEKDAPVRESKNGKAYVMCEDCGMQLFARGHAADKALRARMRPIAPAVAPAPSKTPEAPATAADASETSDKAPREEKRAHPAREKTIFDWLTGETP